MFRNRLLLPSAGYSRLLQVYHFGADKSTVTAACVYAAKETLLFVLVFGSFFIIPKLLDPQEIEHRKNKMSEWTQEK